MADKSALAFAREIIRDSWEGCDGGDIIQELALKHGLIKSEPFDPAVHGTSSECEPGDTWYTFAGPLAGEAAAPSEEPVAAFGEGKLVVDTGTFHSKPAVFIAPAKMPGDVGASAAHEQHDLHSLVLGEIFYL